MSREFIKADFEMCVRAGKELSISGEELSILTELSIFQVSRAFIKADFETCVSQTCLTQLIA